MQIKEINRQVRRRLWLSPLHYNTLTFMLTLLNSPYRPQPIGVPEQSEEQKPASVAMEFSFAIL